MKKHVLIVGGGFGAVKAALELEKHEEFEITILTENSNFKYYPELYHTATGGSEIVSIIPLGQLFAGKNITMVIEKASMLDRQQKTLTTASGRTLHYDILILALGVITNYFGIQGLQDFSFGIKSLEEAERLKSHLQQQLTDERKPDLHYIIIGGGPTGIELAGMLPSYLHELMDKYDIKDRKVHVDLVEAAPRLVPRMPESISRALKKRLRRLGVNVITGKPVQAETADALLVGGKPIRSHTVIWTAGVTNNPFFKDNTFILAQNGKVQVDKLLQAYPGVFVIGDNADTKYSGMAQTALYDADFVTENLIRHSEGKRPYAYKPKKPIYVLPAGPRWAAVVWGPVHLYGVLGWLLRIGADWVGFHDIEPWWKASGRVVAEAIRED